MRKASEVLPHNASAQPCNTVPPAFQIRVPLSPAKVNARATGQMARYLSFAAVTVVGLSERSRGRYARIADFTRTSRDFSLGPKPDLQPCRCDVWFAPDSNQIVDIAASPRCVTLHPKFRWPTCTLSRGVHSRVDAIVGEAVAICTVCRPGKRERHGQSWRRRILRGSHPWRA
jgi:hypothetical protein